MDALWAFSRRLQAGREPWPDCLLLLGDQVYADEVSPETLAFIRDRRDVEQPPGAQVADFEEYARLYREAWSDPDIRWLLSTVPSTMIFDDHDVHDDWNISEAWVQRHARAAVVGGAHRRRVHGVLALPAPRQPRAAGARRGRAVRRALQADEDAGAAAARVRAHGRPRVGRQPVGLPPRLRPLAARRRRLARRPRARRRPPRHGRRRGVGLDRRPRPRRLRPSHHREHAAGVHAAGASTTSRRGTRRSARAPGAASPRALGERVRRAVDLEHWPAFQRSFATMVELLGDLAPRGDGTPPPATITILGGDVHTAYIAEVTLDARQASRVYQLVCSPFRNPLPPRERRVIRMLKTSARRAPHAAARADGGRRAAAGVDWRVVRRPDVRQLDRRAGARRARRRGHDLAAAAARRRTAPPSPRSTRASCQAATETAVAGHRRRGRRRARP